MSTVRWCQESTLATPIVVDAAVAVNIFPNFGVVIDAIITFMQLSECELRPSGT